MLSDEQARTLQGLCDRYGAVFVADEFQPRRGLPAGHVAGWVGDAAYVRVDAEGRVVEHNEVRRRSSSGSARM